MTKTFDIGDQLALATATALEKMATRQQPKAPAKSSEPLVPLNFRIRASAHKKLKSAALAYDMTMTELLEGFIESLPDTRNAESLPAKVTWTKPR
jgi:hypothetical protein